MWLSGKRAGTLATLAHALLYRPLPSSHPPDQAHSTETKQAAGGTKATARLVPVLDAGGGSASEGALYAAAYTTLDHYGAVLQYNTLNCLA